MMESKKTLVAYFSCSGVTRAEAKLLAEAAGADLYEIVPQQPYTKADLDWTDKKSRCTVEMTNQSIRPAVSGKVDSMDSYDTVFIGFPIWWGVAPTVINTFLEGYDLSGKTLIPFATSGGSGMGIVEKNLRPSCAESTKWKPGRILNGADLETLKAWVSSL